MIPVPAFAGVSANHTGGSVIVGAAADACDGTTEGAIRYDGTADTHEYCDGTAWREFIITGDTGAASVVTSETGYFVITSGTWNGNLGGIAGANAKCLSDLTANDWMGKADAVSRGMLDNENVKALMCRTSCQTALSNVTYYFAVSGDNTKGGASFTTDSAGSGTGDAANWSGSTYFDGTKSYWTGLNASSATLWTSTSNHGGTWYCSSWNDGTSGTTGEDGTSNSTGITRWENSKPTCDNVRNLICMVHP